MLLTKPLPELSPDELRAAAFRFAELLDDARARGCAEDAGACARLIEQIDAETIARMNRYDSGARTSDGFVKDSTRVIAPRVSRARAAGSK